MNASSASRSTATFARVALGALICLGGSVALVRADTPKAKPTPTPSPAVTTPCPDCPPIVIGHPRGSNPAGIIVSPDEMHIFPSPYPHGGHIYTVTKSAEMTTILEDGTPQLTIVFRGGKALVGLPGKKPLVSISVAP